MLKGLSQLLKEEGRQAGVHCINRRLLPQASPGLCQSNIFASVLKLGAGCIYREIFLSFFFFLVLVLVKADLPAQEEEVWWGQDLG